MEKEQKEQKEQKDQGRSSERDQNIRMMERERGQFFRTAMDINRASVEHSFNAMRMAQEQTESFLKSYWEQSKRISEEGTKVIDEWTKALQKGREDFRNMLEHGYNQMEDIFKPLERSGERSSSSAKR